MFDAVGGLSTRDGGLGARSGTDLSLRLRAAGGRLVYDGRAALWQHEAPTSRLRRTSRPVADVWGPRLFREAMLDALTGGGRLSSAPFHVAITLMSLDPDDGFGDWYTGHELGDALGAFGWRVSYLERKADGWYDPDPSVEAVIVLLDTCDIRRLPRTVVTMAWVRSWPERWLERPWFDEYDIVFGSSDRIVAMVRERKLEGRDAAAARDQPGPVRPIRSGGPELACDVLFVGNYWSQPRGVVDALPALAERGLSVRVHGRGWDEVPAFSAIDRGFTRLRGHPRRVCVGSGRDRRRGDLDQGLWLGQLPRLRRPGGRRGRRQQWGAGRPRPVRRRLPDLVGRDDRWSSSSRRSWRDPDRAAEDCQAVPRPGPPAPSLRGSGGDDPRRPRALGIGDPLRAPDRRPELGRHRALGRLPPRPGPPAVARASGPSDASAVPARLGDPVAAREDVTVHVFGLKEAPTRPGQVNLLWQISHPDLATPAMYDRYDHVFVASDAFAARMASLTRQPGRPRCTRRPTRSASIPIPPARTTSCCSWRTRGTSGGGSSTTWPARPTTSPCTAAAGCPT